MPGRVRQRFVLSFRLWICCKERRTGCAAARSSSTQQTDCACVPPTRGSAGNVARARPDCARRCCSTSRLGSWENRVEPAVEQRTTHLTAARLYRSAVKAGIVENMDRGIAANLAFRWTPYIRTRVINDTRSSRAALQLMPRQLTYRRSRHAIERNPTNGSPRRTVPQRAIKDARRPRLSRHTTFASAAASRIQDSPTRNAAAVRAAQNDGTRIKGAAGLRARRRPGVVCGVNRKLS